MDWELIAMTAALACTAAVTVCAGLIGFTRAEKLVILILAVAMGCAVTSLNLDLLVEAWQLETMEEADQWLFRYRFISTVCERLMWMGGAGSLIVVGTATLRCRNRFLRTMRPHSA